MIVRRLSIRNYRALREVDIEIDSLTYLVGRNGAGKSTILSALSVFFRQATCGLQDFTMANPAEPIEISVAFERLGATAEAEFAKYVRDGVLTVTKRLVLADGRVAEKYFGLTSQFPGFQEIRAQTGRPRIDAYRGVRDRYGLPTATSGAAVDEALSNWETDHADELVLTEDDGAFFGFTNVGTGKLYKYVDFVLVPAVRDAALDATEVRDSTLRRLVDAVVRRSLNLDDALETFRRQMLDGYQTILERPELSLRSLEDRMTRSIDRFAPGTEVKLAWNEATQPEIPSPSAVARLEDDGLEGDIASKGHGLQRAYVMAALRALAEVESERAQREDQISDRGLLLAVEEPELYQHPAQARHIARTFAELTSTAEGQVQIVACTHSPVFLDIRTIESVRLVRKLPDSLAQTSRATLAEAAARLDRAHQREGRYTADGLRPGLRGLLNPYISEAFFGDFVVLVEGEEDKAILEPALWRHADWPLLASKAIVVTPVGGKKNLDKLVVLLQQLSVPHYVVFDRDGEDNEPADEVVRTNRALQSLMNVAEPVDMPVSGAGARLAVFAPNLGRCVRDEIGEQEWWRYRDEACQEYGIEARKNTEKNPEIVRRMLELAAAEGRTSPTIERCADAIVSAVLEAYPPRAQNHVPAPDGLADPTE